MVLVIANRFDPAADKLAQEWGGSGPLGIITPRELTSEGWIFDPLHPDTGTLVFDGGRAKVKDVRAVLVLLNYIQAAELADVIVAHDRDYVAAESSAFLLAWLTQLTCPVVNKPSSHGLAGPCWREERWAIEADRAGLPIRVTTRRVPGSNEPMMAQSNVVLVNGKAVSGCRPLLEERAAALAKHVGARLLTVTFDASDEGRFLRADPTPNLASDTATRAAVLQQLSRWQQEPR